MQHFLCPQESLHIRRDSYHSLHPSHCAIFVVYIGKKWYHLLVSCLRSFVDYSARERSEMLILNTLHKVIPEKLLIINYLISTGSNPVHNVTACKCNRNNQNSHAGPAHQENSRLLLLLR